MAKGEECALHLLMKSQLHLLNTKTFQYFFLAPIDPAVDASERSDASFKDLMIKG